MNKVCVLIIAALGIVLSGVGCTNNAIPDVTSSRNGGGPGDTHGTDNQCRYQGGTACVGEGAQCGDLVCHCGTWMDHTNPACGQSCTTPPPACLLGAACSGEGLACGDGSGNVCHCGRWFPHQLADQACPDTGNNGGTGGTGGSGGSGNTGNTGGSGNTGNTGGSGNTGNTGGGMTSLTVTVMSPQSEHVWCEGAAVKLSDVQMSDTQAKWTRGWASYGCDSFDGYYQCTLPYDASTERVRFQCYLKANGDPAGYAPDLVRYTCADPSMLQSGESFTTSDPVFLVTNLDPSGKGENCQAE